MTALLILTAALATSNNQPFVRIEATTNSGSGTICVYGGETYILTCAHIFEKPTGGLWSIRRKPPQQVKVLVNRNKELAGWVESLDFERDLAVVRCNGIGSTRVYPVADECPDEGTASRVGYERGQYVFRRGELGGNQAGYRRFEAAGRGGDSGAAILCNGEIVGVCLRVPANQHGGWSLFVPAETIREFLDENPPKELGRK
jgi:hypothetical protein